MHFHTQVPLGSFREHSPASSTIQNLLNLYTKSAATLAANLLYPFLKHFTHTNHILCPLSYQPHPPPSPPIPLHQRAPNSSPPRWCRHEFTLNLNRTARCAFAVLPMFERRPVIRPLFDGDGVDGAEEGGEGARSLNRRDSLDCGKFFLGGMLRLVRALGVLGWRALGGRGGGGEIVRWGR